MRLCIAILLTLIEIGCAHKDIATSAPRLGQNKSDVVEIYGSPAQTWRFQSKDHWLYQTANGEKKILVFEADKLVNIRSPKTESVDADEDLESELRKMRESSKGEFQDLGE